MLTVTRTSCAAGVREPGDLDARWQSGSAVSVLVIDCTTTGMRGADQHAADVDRDRRPADRPQLVRRRHGVPPTCFAMSNTVIQIRNVNSATNPTA